MQGEAADRVDKEAAKRMLGPKFDADKFNAASDESGTASKAALLAAVGVVLVDKDAHKAIPLLMALDDKLEATLKSGALKLVSAEYMRSAEAGDRILRRQDLEELERKKGIKVFLTATEAVIALRSNGRLIGSLTYGWSAPGSPDEGGHYFVAVQRFLRSADGAHIVGIFWE